jgi:hypothetical protein
VTPEEGSSTTLRFDELASLAGATRLSRALGGSEDDAQAIQERAQDYLRLTPELADLEIGKVSDGAVYQHGSHRIGVSDMNPDSLAHELEHAKALGGPGSAYRTLVNLSKGATELSAMASIPAVAGLRAFVDDTEKRRNILRILAGVSAATALPNIFEEGRASANAAWGSSDRMHAVKTLLPALGEHVAKGLIAPGVFLAGTRL